MTHSIPRRKAFATTTAVILLGLAATAVLMLTSALTADLKRTARQQGDMQLRQLLLVGTEAARQRLATGSTTADATAVELPPELAADSATVTIAVKPAVAAETSEVTVVARIGERSLSQQLVIAKDFNKWTILSATLTP